MNENDSEIIAGLLEKNGYTCADSIDTAGLVITNTCSVRDTAESKARGFIQNLVHIKKANPSVLIGVVGCMAERIGEELLNKHKFIDFVIGPNKEQNIIAIIDEVKMTKARFGQFGDSREFKPLPGSRRQGGPNAWITIMEGCNNFCSFCIVPHVRGREKSRPAEDVLAEIGSLDKSVYKEITLLGQNVNSYAYGFAALLAEAEKAEGIHRVRFMTSHPKDMSDDIIKAVKNGSKICENFHLPLQSGDDEVLKAMNRGYSRDYYIRLVEKIKDKIPGASITSDAIAGFPGETEAQFNNTLDLIEKLELDSVITAAFNPRPGTKAYAMDGRLPEAVSAARLQALMETVEKTASKRNRKLEGTVQEILIDEDGIGRTRTNKTVKFTGEDIGRPGTLVNVRIKSAKSWVLQGELIN